MLKLLLVDDDYVAMMQVKSLLKEAQLPPFEIHEANNGRNAVLCIPDVQPDIIISDVSMPAMNGIELAKHVREHYPLISMILLSAYDDFEYVHDGLLVGVTDYLLKQRLSAHILHDAIIRSISAEKWRDEGIRKHSDGAHTYSDLVINYNKNSIIAKQKKLCYVVVAYEYPAESDDTKADNSTLKRNALDDIIARTFQNQKDIAVIQTASRAGFLYAFPKDADEREAIGRLEHIIIRAQNNAFKFFNERIVFSYGKCFNKYDDIYEAFKAATLRLNLKFFVPNESIIGGEKEQTNQPFLVDSERMYTIVNCLERCDAEGYRNLMVTLFEEIAAVIPQYIYFQMLCCGLASEIKRLCIRRNVEISDAFALDNGPFLLPQSSISIQDCQCWFLDMGNRVIKDIQNAPSMEKISSATQLALKYISNHYNENISLTAAASDIGFNSSYLSRMFKKDMGISFVNYINKYRMEIASELIRNRRHSRMKLSDVACKVGFSNYSYFYSLFKKYYGVTPEEYKPEDS